MAETEIPGTIKVVYKVSENSDKTEGRGRTIRTKYFFSKVLAEDWAKGRGAMGTDEYISEMKVILGRNGRWYHLGSNFVERIEDDEKVLAILEKLSPEERKALRNYMK